MKLSNGVEMYETEVTKMGQKYSFFLTVQLTSMVNNVSIALVGVL